jgi:cell wall assembly regulator SMI1
MQDISRRVHDVVGRVVAAIRDLNVHEGVPDEDPEPGPPASEADIRAAEAAIGVRFPPQYRAFLRMHDGYRWLAYPGDMLPLRDLMPGSAMHEQITKWKRLAAEYGGGEVLNGLFFASLGQPNNWIYFDLDRPTEGAEYTVVRFTPDESSEFPDLIAFLESRIDVCNVEIPDEGEDGETQE